jgi:hypothetical protein
VFKYVWVVLLNVGVMMFPTTEPVDAVITVCVITLSSKTHVKTYGPVPDRLTVTRPAPTVVSPSRAV